LEPNIGSLRKSAYSIPESEFKNCENFEKILGLKNLATFAFTLFTSKIRTYSSEALAKLIYQYINIEGMKKEGRICFNLYLQKKH